mgnify:CR=1 FL=1
MQTNYEAEQLSIYDLDSWCGRMFLMHFNT